MAAAVAAVLAPVAPVISAAEVAGPLVLKALTRKLVLLLDVIFRLPEEPSAWMPAAARVVLAATAWLIWLATSAALAEVPRENCADSPKMLFAVPFST